MAERLVLLKRTYDPTEAHIIRGLLENNDIPVFVMDDHHNTVAWHMQIALGGARVMVLTKDIEEAKSLLHEQTSIAPEPLERATPSYISRIWQLIIFFWTGLPFKFRSRFPEKEEKQQ